MFRVFGVRGGGANKIARFSLKFHLKVQQGLKRDHAFCDRSAVEILFHLTPSTFFSVNQGVRYGIGEGWGPVGKIKTLSNSIQ